LSDRICAVARTDIDGRGELAFPISKGLFRQSELRSLLVEMALARRFRLPCLQQAPGGYAEKLTRLKTSIAVGKPRSRLAPRCIASYPGLTGYRHDPRIVGKMAATLSCRQNLI
jgi:hypothetical protein